VEERFGAAVPSPRTTCCNQDTTSICLTLPLTAETERLIGAQEFALMGPETIFINISRGKVVDEAALVEALQQRTIRAAGWMCSSASRCPTTRRCCA